MRPLFGLWGWGSGLLPAGPESNSPGSSAPDLHPPQRIDRELLWEAEAWGRARLLVKKGAHSQSRGHALSQAWGFCLAFVYFCIVWFTAFVGWLVHGYSRI